VWLATDFREEHRQSLDWLNENTSEEIRFFAVVLRVVRIGGSAPAPLLKLVAEPNDWQKTVRAATHSGRLEGKGALYVEFWGKFIGVVRERHPDWTRSTKPGSANWFSMRSSLPGTEISSSFALRHQLRHELYIDGGDADANDALFASLLSQRDALERAYGRELQFEELPNKRASRIAEYADGDVSEVARHEEFIEWFLDAGERIRRALASIVV